MTLFGLFIIVQVGIITIAIIRRFISIVNSVDHMPDARDQLFRNVYMYFFLEYEGHLAKLHSYAVTMLGSFLSGIILDVFFASPLSIVVSSILSVVCEV